MSSRKNDATFKKSFTILLKNYDTEDHSLKNRGLYGFS